ncbi:MAG TPA: hypothetical protein VG937_32375 [Polyangiaceae bacterium]|nr:hypothetical protein [Polyangiaceae bacterium]
MVRTAAGSGSGGSGSGGSGSVWVTARQQVRREVAYTSGVWLQGAVWLLAWRGTRGYLRDVVSAWCV